MLFIVLVLVNLSAHAEEREVDLKQIVGNVDKYQWIGIVKVEGLPRNIGFGKYVIEESWIGKMPADYLARPVRTLMAPIATKRCLFISKDVVIDAPISEAAGTLWVTFIFGEKTPIGMRLNEVKRWVVLMGKGGANQNKEVCFRSPLTPLKGS